MCISVRERKVLPGGYILVTDPERGIGLIADPPDGRLCSCCARRLCYWDVTFGFQIAGMKRMQRKPYRLRHGMN